MKMVAAECEERYFKSRMGIVPVIKQTCYRRLFHWASMNRNASKRFPFLNCSFAFVMTILQSFSTLMSINVPIQSLLSLNTIHLWTFEFIWNQIYANLRNKLTVTIDFWLMLTRIEYHCISHLVGIITLLSSVLRILIEFNVVVFYIYLALTATTKLVCLV